MQRKKPNLKEPTEILSELIQSQYLPAADQNEKAEEDYVRRQQQEEWREKKAKADTLDQNNTERKKYARYISFSRALGPLVFLRSFSLSDLES